MEIQIISGFLGAGKTTFLNKYFPLLPGKTAIIENEFGEVGLDGALIQGDLPVKELSAGCICCSLAIDLKDGIAEIIEKYAPDRILIEPSGVGKLSDVVSACEKVNEKMETQITNKIVIVDACDCALYAEEFGQFYSNQIACANVILLSNLQEASDEEKTASLACIKELNPYAVVYDEDWRELEGDALLAILDAGVQAERIADKTADVQEEEPEISFSPTNQVFSSIVLEDSCAMTEQEIQELLRGFGDDSYGQVLRAKGIVPAVDGEAWHFDYTHSVQNYEKLEKAKNEINRVIVIGSGMNKKELRKFVYSFGEE